MNHRHTDSPRNSGYERTSGLALKSVDVGAVRQAARSTRLSEPAPAERVAGTGARFRGNRRRVHTGRRLREHLELRLRLRPAALGRENQALERVADSMPLARADGVKHREYSGRLRAAPCACVRDEAGALFRQARRAIADEQSFAEPRHGFDVVLARTGREMIDRVAVRPFRIALLGAADVWQRALD